VGSTNAPTFLCAVHDAVGVRYLEPFVDARHVSVVAQPSNAMAVPETQLPATRLLMPDMGVICERDWPVRLSGHATCAGATEWHAAPDVAWTASDQALLAGLLYLSRQREFPPASRCLQVWQ
jgi:hypothetical protein